MSRPVKPTLQRESSPFEDLFAEDVRNVLLECGTPDHWIEDSIAQRLCRIAWYPNLFITAPKKPRDERAFAEMSSAERGNELRHQNYAENSALFASLYAESPDVFLMAMTNLRTLWDKNFQLPVFEVAAQLWHRHRAEDDKEKAEALAHLFSELLDRVITAKTVEKARALVRAAKPFTPQPVAT